MLVALIQKYFKGYKMIEYYSIRDKKTGDEVGTASTIDEALIYCDKHHFSPTFYEIIKVII